MATTIRIKRSATAGNPSTLGAGELAYSSADASSVSGGDRLYIGTGSENDGNASVHEVIGGKYFVSKLNHTAGTLTANAAIITDSSSKIDVLNVDNVTIDGNSITSTNNDGDLILTPNGAGDLVLDGVNWPQSDGSSGQYLKTNGSGQLSWGTVQTTFDIAGDSGSDTFSTGETLTVSGTDPIDVAISNNTITISAKDANTTAKGIASFNSSNFSITSGAVSIATGGVDTTQLAADAVDGTKIADDAIDSEHITDGSIDSVHLAADVIDSTKIADDAVDSEHIVDGAIDSVHLAADVIDGTKIADDAVDSEHIVDGSIDNVHLAGSISNDKLLNSSLTISDGNLNSTTVDLGQTLTVYGTTNEITVAAANSSLTVSLPDDVSGLSSISANTITGVIQTAAQPNITSLGTLTALTVDNVSIDGNEISSTSGDLSLTASGDIDVNSKRIKSVGSPTADTDAATKAYVDSVAQGLHVHAACHIATTDTFAAMTSGTVTYDNGTNGVGATLTTTGTIPATWDGHTIHDGERILVKDETDATHNGIYVYDSASPKVITRADDFDTNTEIAGGDFVFVQFGTVNGETGWVQVLDVDTIGTDDVEFTQFSGAGHIEAGDGLSLSGTVFSVNVDDSSLEISADTLQVKALGITNAMLAGSIDLTSKVTGTLPVTNGGTGASTFTTNGILYGGGTGAIQATAAGTNGYFLYSASGTPAWTNVVDGGTY